MQPNHPLDSSASPNGATQDRGLPPVTAPSGRHILQLFLVPGMIVVVLVLFWLGITWLTRGQSSPEKMLDGLEAANADVRWRAANDLTQRLKRDDQLASDPTLALRLAELLHKRMGEYADAQANYRSRVNRKDDQLADDSLKTLREKRKDVQFLIPCAGSLILPTGAPVLCEVLRKNETADEKGTILLRRDAVWSLANLGDNVKRFRKLSEERRSEIIGTLTTEAAAGDSERKRLAQQTLDYVQKLQEGQQPASMGVVAALTGAAQDDGEDSDPFLRELVAYAFNFWQGSPAEEKESEQALVQLSHDSGRGKTVEIGEDD